MIFGTQRLQLPIFGDFEHLNKEKLFANNTIPNYGLGKYFWTPNAISVNNFYIQGFYGNDLHIRVPYITGFNRLYQVNMKKSTEKDNVYIHDIKHLYKIPIGLHVFWKMMLDNRYLCLNGGGAQNSPSDIDSLLGVNDSKRLRVWTDQSEKWRVQRDECFLRDPEDVWKLEDDRKLAELEQFCSGTFVPKDPTSVVFPSPGSGTLGLASED